jgi:hypothetical protein
MMLLPYSKDPATGLRMPSMSSSNLWTKHVVRLAEGNLNVVADIFTPLQVECV